MAEPYNSNNFNREPVQPPPPPPITIRTMESDRQSMQSSGGTPIPQPVKPGELKIPEPEEEPIFTPPTPMDSGEPEKSEISKWTKTAGLIAGIIILITGFGFLGYYFVYPLIFPSQPELPAIQEPLPSAPLIPPLVEGLEPAETPAPSLVHRSFFTSPANQLEPLVIATVTIENIREAMAVSAMQTLDANGVKEIVFETQAGLIIAPEFLSALLPILTQEETSTNFEDDFTAYLYYDQNGVWPGFIFKLKTTAILFETQTIVEKLETVAVSMLKNIYIADPQNPTSAIFLSGQIKGTATKYLPFEVAGASLNYGIISNYFLISSSFGGVQEAANRLGL
ncbi:hypothetical protein A3A20_02765 [Candidatus Wolfebacteria bacterium RIFCSPLOWO2_01_FULL_45_19]|uniref:Uncharacterized protein n=1 Tax=Candidatus Wolfebacteria bacterium RIFCSPLOWO2_01_FULL_45_19 TaxID=1802557 RepID=A0A1F8DTZ8_9BACT|nr:MAG: hypothetical protein UX23_C0005G0041 [Parcubacteria group bacterium GW2011_GWB1_45_9]OGM91469.1 MAG: hypothetical protein A3A20_02765 [Candidatus Wolfebacteria bacterium RIFCSPLOWO2_01_FULL_45_19]